MSRVADATLVARLRGVCGEDAVFTDRLDLLTYECDGLPHLRQEPAVVVLPGSTAEVQAVVRLCHEHGVPFVALSEMSSAVVPEDAESVCAAAIDNAAVESLTI